MLRQNIGGVGVDSPFEFAFFRMEMHQENRVSLALLNCDALFTSERYKGRDYVPKIFEEIVAAICIGVYGLLLIEIG
jgi:hypothetical protein